MPSTETLAANQGQNSWDRAALALGVVDDVDAVALDAGRGLSRLPRFDHELPS